MMNTQRVLVITDLEKTGRQWNRIVQPLGVDVVIDNTLTATLDLNRDASFPLIIVDMHTDPYSVIDLCRRLRLRSESVILLLLADGNVDLFLRAYDAEADECISAAVSDDLLAAKTKAWLRWSPAASRRTAKRAASQHARVHQPLN